MLYYRRINLLSLFSKVLEYLLWNCLHPILKIRNIITDYPFRLRHEHGSFEQFHRRVRNIAQGLEKKQHWPAIFLDIIQAFNKEWHRGLLC